MSHATESHDMPARRIEAVSSGLRIAIPVLIALGGLALVAALFVDAARGWRAYTINWLFMTSVAQGGLMLAVVTSIAKGLWSRPMRRIALAHVAFLPVAFVLVLPILIWGAPHIWPWIEHPLYNGKEVWLNRPFFTARTVFGLAALFGLSLAFAYTALRPDMGLLRDSVPARLRGMYDLFTRNWRGQEAEELHAYRRLNVLGPAMALTFALVMGVLSWDFVMSLEPSWFSTLIGPYFFMGGVLGGTMVTALILIALRDRMGLDMYITPATMHDLGKLAFGFTVFWGYMFFSQYIVIWYGLLPWEQPFVIHRFVPPFRLIAQMVAVCLFVIPFFGLMGVAAKRTPAVFATLAIISLFGLWLERYLLVYPSLWIDTETLPLSWQEPGLLLLFAGLYLSSIAFFLTRFPLFQIWQPLGELELAGIQEDREETGDLGGDVMRPAGSDH
ncbi:MAG TPA: hypothetical protein VK929_15225 [Longimicrobiales bacterium]|nr:hypothetical protein [Longimicrobiales bacterium]